MTRYLADFFFYYLAAFFFCSLASQERKKKSARERRKKKISTEIKLRGYRLVKFMLKHVYKIRTCNICRQNTMFYH